MIFLRVITHGFNHPLSALALDLENSMRTRFIMRPLLMTLALILPTIATLAADHAAEIEKVLRDIRQDRPCLPSTIYSGPTPSMPIAPTIEAATTTSTSRSKRTRTATSCPRSCCKSPGQIRPT